MYGVKFVRGQEVKNSAGQSMGRTLNHWEGAGEGRILKITEVPDPFQRIVGSAIIDCGMSGDKLVQSREPELRSKISALKPGDVVRFVGTSLPNRKSDGFHVVLHDLEIVPEPVAVAPFLVTATPVENSPAA